MFRFFPLVALFCVLATCAFAQPGPNGAPNPAQPQPGGNRGGNMLDGILGAGLNNTALDVLPAGVMVLRNGVLAKFDQTLKPTGTLELFGALPVQPVMPQNPTQQDRDAMRAWFSQVANRTGTAAMLANHDTLFIVIGSNFFRVNAKTMILEAKADLNADAAGNPPAAGPAAFLRAGVPFLRLDADTLYVVVGANLLTINANTGNILNRATLPKEMTPAIQGGGFPGGRGNGGGPDAGAGRGNRGGRGGGGDAGAVDGNAD